MTHDYRREDLFTKVTRFVLTFFTGMFVGTVIAAIVLSLVGCSGPQGMPGPRGQTGAPIPVTTRPATVLECPTGGTALSVGNQDVVVCNGGLGAIGPTGANGSNGLDATQVTVVMLCPGATAYPNIFTEIALCINHQLYAAYSIPGAFLTYIPPGNYISNGVNSSCTFTAHDDCLVTN